jgi:hypothetical protein
MQLRRLRSLHIDLPVEERDISKSINQIQKKRNVVKMLAHRTRKLSKCELKINKLWDKTGRKRNPRHIVTVYWTSGDPDVIYTLWLQDNAASNRRGGSGEEQHYSPRGHYRSAILISWGSQPSLQGFQCGSIAAHLTSIRRKKKQRATKEGRTPLVQDGTSGHKIVHNLFYQHCTLVPYNFFFSKNISWQFGGRIVTVWKDVYIHIPSNLYCHALSDYRRGLSS